MGPYFASFLTFGMLFYMANSHFEEGSQGGTIVKVSENDSPLTKVHFLERGGQRRGPFVVKIAQISPNIAQIPPK